jgi:hypothetical protein
MFLRSRLPDNHFSPDSRDAIKLATAVIGTLSALALGLLIASAKRSFDDAGTELRTWAGRVLLADRVMAHYGTETTEIRGTLRKLMEARLRATRDNTLSERPLDHGPPCRGVVMGLVPFHDGRDQLAKFGPACALAFGRSQFKMPYRIGSTIQLPRILRASAPAKCASSGSDTSFSLHDLSV